MVTRYADAVISQITADEAKLARWQTVELAAIGAKAMHGLLHPGVATAIGHALREYPIDLGEWLRLDTKLHHDLLAAVRERQSRLPPELRFHYHADLTSYDVVDPAFVLMLRLCVHRVLQLLSPLPDKLRQLALEFRYTPMLERTHGQGAEVQSAGFRFLRWYKELCDVILPELTDMAKNLRYGKLSGAIGTNSTFDPTVERSALAHAEIALEPYRGASQILPRSLFVGLAGSFVTLVQLFETIANTVRLGARSDLPTMREGFGGRQVGSSAMPHKRNPITCEQMKGLGAIVRGYLSMIRDTVPSEEARIIDQSSIERLAWPDLFHTVCWAIKQVTTLLSRLEVYPDNMLEEIVRSRGCFASSRAKELLAELATEREETQLTSEEAYRIIQLAAWKAHDISSERRLIRTRRPGSLEEAQETHRQFLALERHVPRDLRMIIREATLRPMPELDISRGAIEALNRKLEAIFAIPEHSQRWDELFDLTRGMQQETTAYEEVLGLPAV